MSNFHRSLRNLEIEKLKVALSKGIGLKGSMLAVCSSQRSDFRAQLEIIDTLLDHGVDINETDKNGVTPLHRAVRIRNPKAVKALLRKGADVNRTCKRTASTPLHRAVVHSGAPSTKGKNEETIEIIKILLRNGANPHIENRKGKIPIDYVTAPAMTKLLQKDKIGGKG